LRGHHQRRGRFSFRGAQGGSRYGASGVVVSRRPRAGTLAFRERGGQFATAAFLPVNARGARRRPGEGESQLMVGNG
jgi:hypothetical protein